MDMILSSPARGHGNIHQARASDRNFMREPWPRSAARFCRAYDELRNVLRLRARHHQHVPADCQRLLHLQRTATVLAILEAA